MQLLSLDSSKEWAQQARRPDLQKRKGARRCVPVAHRQLILEIPAVCQIWSSDQENMTSAVVLVVCPDACASCTRCATLGAAGRCAAADLQRIMCMGTEVLCNAAPLEAAEASTAAKLCLHHATLAAFTSEHLTANKLPTGDASIQQLLVCTLLNDLQPAVTQAARAAAGSCGKGQASKYSNSDVHSKNVPRRSRRSLPTASAQTPRRPRPVWQSATPRCC